MVWGLIAKLADFPGELAVPKPPAKLPDNGIASKRMNIRAKSMERTGKRGLPTTEPTYLTSIRLTVRLISILENNNLRVSSGSPRNRFKLRYHLP
jgi:hypothetical protein